MNFVNMLVLYISNIRKHFIKVITVKIVPRRQINAIPTHHAWLTTRCNHFFQFPVVANTGSQVLKVIVQHGLGSLQCQPLQLSKAWGNGGVTGIPVANHSLQQVTGQTNLKTLACSKTYSLLMKMSRDNYCRLLTPYVYTLFGLMQKVAYKKF